MSNWGAATYGDPCRECGYDWSTSMEEATAIISDVPSAYAELLATAKGSERHPDLSWPVVGYVCHVGDNLRIWAERLAGIAAGALSEVDTYDENLLAEARAYAGVSLPGALWSLKQAAADFGEAVQLAATNGAVLVHPERGEQHLADVVRSVSHDASHHRWDITRSLGEP